MTASLQLDDATLNGIAGTLKQAATRLQTLSRALQGLDTDVVGADPLIEGLKKMQESLGGRLGLLGLGVDELAGKVTDVSTVSGQTDQDLAHGAHSRFREPR